MPAISIRRIHPDELRRFLDVLAGAYGITVDDRYVAAWRGAFDYDRNLALFHGDRLAGTATSGLVDVTTPGPLTVPAAVTGNLTIDGSAPIPGLAVRLFQHQCRQHRDEGVPFVVFSAYSPAIARMHLRIGSAPATASTTISVDAGRPAERGGPGGRRVEELPLLAEDLDQVQRRVAATTPGMIVRARSWMVAYRTLSAAGTPLVAWGHRDGAGRLDGYAVWYETADGGPLVVDELIAETEPAWQDILLRLLAETERPVELRHRPVADPVRWWLRGRGMAAERPVRDALWIRLLDVPAALRSRRYRAADRVVIEVDDPFLPEVGGRFLLEASPDGAECRPTGRTPDLRLGVGALGAAYLGATSVLTLVRAGLGDATSAGAAERCAALFTTPVPPWSGSER